MFLKMISYCTQGSIIRAHTCYRIKFKCKIKFKCRVHIIIISFLNLYHNVLVLGYEPADLTVHPPPNDRGWVHFFRIGV